MTSTTIGRYAHMTHQTVVPDYRLDDFETWMRSWGASNDTVRARLTVARQFAAYWPDPTTVDPLAVENFLGSSHFTGWTRTTYYGHLRCLFGWMSEHQLVQTNPTLQVRRPKPPKNKPRPLSDDEAERVLATATGDLRTWLLLGMYAGLRTHEVVKIEGIHVTPTTTFVHGKGGKDDELPTHPMLWEAAQTYPRRGYWFPSWGRRGHLRSDRLTWLVTAHFRKNDIEEGSFHRCRHTYGTNLLRAGVNLRVVQSLMRHESLTTTAAYLAVDEDERMAAIRLLAGLGR